MHYKLNIHNKNQTSTIKVILLSHTNALNTVNSMSFTYNIILVCLPVAWYSEMVSVTGVVRGNCSFSSVNDNYSCVERQLLLGVKRLLLLGAQVAGFGCYS